MYEPHDDTCSDVSLRNFVSFFFFSYEGIALLLQKRGRKKVYGRCHAGERGNVRVILDESVAELTSANAHKA